MVAGFLVDKVFVSDVVNCFRLLGVLLFHRYYREGVYE